MAPAARVLKTASSRLRWKGAVDIGCHSMNGMAGAQTTIGLFIAVLAVAALAAFAVWEEWLSLIAGLWLIGSPWVLGFEDTDTVRLYVVTGTIVAALAAFKVWLVHQGDRRITLGN